MWRPASSASCWCSAATATHCSGTSSALCCGDCRFAAGCLVRFNRLGFDRLGRHEAADLVAGKLQLAGFEQRAAGQRQCRHRAARRLPIAAPPHAAATAGRQRPAKILGPGAGIEPAAAAGWRGFLAGHHHWIGQARFTKRHPRRVEAHHHMAHGGHLAQRADPGHGRRLNRMNR